MKTVGIITCPYLINFGSVLQAYALRRYLNQLPGYRAELIHYIPEEFRHIPYEPGMAGKTAYEQKVHSFEMFLETECGIVGEPIHRVTGNQFDYYCVGSDQLWNFRIFDKSQEFFLSNLDPDAKKISYATSLGQSVDQLKKHRDLFKKRLKSFKAISVRESVHTDFLRDECGLESECVVDPTFLLDGADYDRLAAKNSLRAYPFILFLWYIHDGSLLAGVEFANMLSRKYGIPIVHTVFGSPHYLFANDGGCVMYESIENFLWYIKNAKVIVTDSYHTTLFSIYFKKPFYTFIVDSMRSRFDTLREYMPIASRIVTRYISPDQISLDLDYEEIYAAVEPYRQKSRTFLARALDEGGI